MRAAAQEEVTVGGDLMLIQIAERVEVIVLSMKARRRSISGP